MDPAHCSPPALPPVSDREMTQLCAQFGHPLRRHFDIELDDYMLATRCRRQYDRRGEVLFAITRPNGRVLLHTKARYPQGVFRLFTGGIGLRESVHDALLREVTEETGLQCRLERFVALCTYSFRGAGLALDFATYAFHMSVDAAQRPNPEDQTEVAHIGEIAWEGLPAVATRLRSLEEKRRVWGHWRAIGHDMLYEGMNRSMQEENA